MTGGARLSVVTPFRNAPRSLRLMLDGLAGQTLERDRWEVIVVDDASGLPLQPLLDASPPGLAVRLVSLGERRGPGGARNAGAEVATGDILVFLDSDVVAAPDVLRTHLAAHQEEGVAVVYGHRYESGWETIHRVARGDLRPPDSPVEADFRDERLGGDPARSRAPWLWSYSHNLSLPRALMAEVGGFDEGFRGWGHEDIELGYRLFDHLGRSAEPFRYRRDAYGFHVPHFVHAAGNRLSGQENLRHLKRRHRRWDVELYADQWPSTVAAKIPEYERGIEALVSQGLGAFPPALADALAPDARLLVVAAGAAVLGPRGDRVVRHDHSRPLGPDNGHLLGTWTTLDDDTFDAVVSVDLWRVLTTHDLNRMIAESLRLAPRLVLVESGPGAGAASGTATAHLRQVLEHLFTVRPSPLPDGTVLEICRRDTPPIVTAALRPAGLSAGT